MALVTLVLVDVVSHKIHTCYGGICDTFYARGLCRFPLYSKGTCLVEKWFYNGCTFFYYGIHGIFRGTLLDHLWTYIIQRCVHIRHTVFPLSPLLTNILKWFQENTFCRFKNYYFANASAMTFKKILFADSKITILQMRRPHNGTTTPPSQRHIAAHRRPVRTVLAVRNTIETISDPLGWAPGGSVGSIWPP